MIQRFESRQQESLTGDGLDFEPVARDLVVTGTELASEAKDFRPGAVLIWLEFHVSEANGKKAGNLASQVPPRGPDF